MWTFFVITNFILFILVGHSTSPHSGRERDGLGNAHSGRDEGQSPRYHLVQHHSHAPAQRGIRNKEIRNMKYGTWKMGAAKASAESCPPASQPPSTRPQKHPEAELHFGAPRARRTSTTVGSPLHRSTQAVTRKKQKTKNEHARKRPSPCPHQTTGHTKRSFCVRLPPYHRSAGFPKGCWLMISGAM